MTENTPFIFHISIAESSSNMKRINSSNPININCKEYVCRPFRRNTY